MHFRALPGILAIDRCSLSLAAVAAPSRTTAPHRASALDAQIDRIFKDRAYEAPRFGPARWLPDGTAYAVVERAAGGGSEIDTYDAVTGARTVLVPASRLGAAGPRPARSTSTTTRGRTTAGVC